MLFKLALRELIRSWRFGLFFIFNLCLGLTGFVALEAFNVALKEQIQANAKSILSADLAVAARREITPEELAKVQGLLPAGTEASKVYEFFAMMSSSKGSRLVMVKAIDSAYPFYGSLELESGQKITQTSVKDILAGKKVWIYPELRSQLGLAAGDEVKIGNLNLIISDVVKKDETQTFRGASLAPRVFLDVSLLAQSGLLQFGSTFSLAYLYKLPAGVAPEELQKDLYKSLPDPQIIVQTPQSAGEDSGRQLGYLSDYLGLVALVALFLSALGAAYLYRLFLSTRMGEIAILRTLGLQSYQAVGVYVLQTSLLGALATLPTLAISYTLLPLLSQLLQSFTPFSLRPQVGGEAVLICFLMAVFGSLIVSFPYIVKIYELKTSKLFSEEKFSAAEGAPRFWTFIPAFLLFYALAVYQAHSWKIGTLFVGSLLVVIILLLGMGFFVIRLAAVFETLTRWYFKYSFLSLSRRASASLAVFVALGLGALLINILPQLKNSLQSEFKVEGKGKIPSLFMFDIQDEQLQGVQSLLEKNGVKPLGLSALVRARILKVNNQDYERQKQDTGFKTREEENEARFRNRGVNLSYRTSLSDSEALTAGRPLSGAYNPDSKKRPELSVEYKFAERMGLKLGDILLFDVQGVEIEGEIVNLRRVKWTSFQPNFFILFQPGVLEEAPKTFIAAIPSLGENRRVQLQNQFVETFPNISVVDVVRTVDDVLKMAEKMSWSLELMAFLALLTGYIVLFSIVRSQIQLRRWELNMLKILGASEWEVSKFILNEFAYLSFLAALTGALLSVGVSFSLNQFIFDSEFILSWQQPVFSVGIITVVSLMISFFASLDIVKEKSLRILREDK